MKNKKWTMSCIVTATIALGAMSLYAFEHYEALNSTGESHMEVIGENMPYEIVEQGNWMDTSYIEELNETVGDVPGYVFEEEGEQYLVARGGEVPSGGYTVEINSVVKVGEKVHVYGVLVEPSPESMTLQVISYPYTVIKLQEPVDPECVTFRVEGLKNPYHGTKPTVDDVQNEVIRSGKIIDLDENTVHLLQGDMIEIFDYIPTQDPVYIGQYVELVRGESGIMLQPSSTMVDEILMLQGIPLQSFTGKVVGEDEGTLLLQVGDETLLFNDYNNRTRSYLDARVTVYAADFGEGLSVVHKLCEDTKLELTIEEIVRADNGTMQLLTVDEQGAPYHFSPSGVLVGFDIGTLQVGDTVVVYYEMIQESYPMGIVATYVDLKPYSLDTDGYTVGDVIAHGDIVAFDKNTVHIMSGSVIGIYDYDTSYKNNFYIGQSVELIKGEVYNTLQEAKRNVVNDPMSVKGTPMVPYTGEVIEETEDTITLNVEGEVVLFADYKTEGSPSYLGKHVTIYGAQLGDRLTAILINDEDTKLEMTVQAITRGYTGEMLIEAVDETGVCHTFSISRVTMDFEMMTIQEGDTLVVYHQNSDDENHTSLQPTFITRP